MPWMALIVLLFPLWFAAPGCTPTPTDEALEFRNEVISRSVPLRSETASLIAEGNPGGIRTLFVSFFEKYWDEKSPYLGLVAFDNEAKVLCAYSPVEDATRVKGLNFSNYEAIRKALKSERTTTMVLYYLQNGKRFTMPAVNFPLDRNGEVVGILSVFFLRETLEAEYGIKVEEFERLEFGD